MLKLIVTDMDGTLLNSKGEMPKRAIPLIKKLREKGVKFAVASGRQYHNLANLYEEVKDDIIFIADNGGAVFDGEMNILHAGIPRDELKRLTEIFGAFDGARPTYRTGDTAYFFKGDFDDALRKEATGFYAGVNVVGNVDEIPEDVLITSMSVNHPDGVEETIYNHVQHLQNQYKITMGNARWLDLTNANVNKGNAVKMLQEKYDIAHEETMVFGDYLNDFEMMSTAYYSYAMENAHPDLKRVSTFTAPSNDEEGVIKIIENFLSMAFRD